MSKRSINFLQQRMKNIETLHGTSKLFNGICEKAGQYNDISSMARFIFRLSLVFYGLPALELSVDEIQEHVKSHLYISWLYSMIYTNKTFAKKECIHQMQMFTLSDADHDQLQQTDTFLYYLYLLMFCR